jgi:hypothetical protein
VVEIESENSEKGVRKGTKAVDAFNRSEKLTLEHTIKPGRCRLIADR